MKRLSIVISVASLVGVLILAGLWIFSSTKLSVVSLDTFIGVSVAVLAIVFTVIVGLQIVNTIDMKDRMAELERIQKEQIDIERRLAENDMIQTKQAYNLQASICSTNGDIYRAQGYYIEAWWCYHSALYYSILSEQPNQPNRINILNSVTQQISTKPISDFSIAKPQIKFESEEIKKTQAYRNYLFQMYNSALAAFETKLKKIGVIPQSEQLFVIQSSIYENTLQK